MPKLVDLTKARNEQSAVTSPKRIRESRYHGGNRMRDEGTRCCRTMTLTTPIDESLLLAGFQMVMNDQNPQEHQFNTAQMKPGQL